MKSIEGIGLHDVTAIYDGPEGDLWELIMGQQIHIGGLRASMDLAERAGIGAGQHGVDLCCCSGAGMRFLVRFRGVASMVGVDAASRVIETGRRRCEEEGLGDRIRFVLADSCNSGLPEGGADFVWSEDAWCYVIDKPKLIAEAVRIVRPGGTIALTDWVEGPAGLSQGEADHLLHFMKFPNIEDFDGYRGLFQEAGAEVLEAADTDRFAPHMDLYLNFVEMQLTYDALRIMRFDSTRMAAVADGFKFLQRLGHAGKVAQGRFIARRI